MKDLHKTQVVFRKWKDGTIDALMPYLVELNYKVTVYSRVGQHSIADYDYVLSVTTSANPEEYKDLLNELERIGYNVEVIKRVDKNKMSDLWYEMNLEHSKIG